MDTPVPILLTELNALRVIYKGVPPFRAEPKGLGLWNIMMNPTESYTDGKEKKNDDIGGENRKENNEALREGNNADQDIEGITNKGEMLGDFGIPKYYTYTSKGESIFVHPHAMKHLEELASHGAGNPRYLRLLGQTHQKALHSAIDDILSRGPIEFRKMYNSGGNEIMFGAPKGSGLFPAVIHFR